MLLLDVIPLLLCHDHEGILHRTDGSMSYVVLMTLPDV